jgi:hypothetical protein
MIRDAEPARHGSACSELNTLRTIRCRDNAYPERTKGAGRRQQRTGRHSPQTGPPDGTIRSTASLTAAEGGRGRSGNALSDQWEPVRERFI